MKKNICSAGFKNGKKWKRDIAYEMALMIDWYLRFPIIITCWYHYYSSCFLIIKATPHRTYNVNYMFKNLHPSHHFEGNKHVSNMFPTFTHLLIGIKVMRICTYSTYISCRRRVRWYDSNRIDLHYHFNPSLGFSSSILHLHHHINCFAVFYSHFPHRSRTFSKNIITSNVPGAYY